ncbi:MAG: oxaloacetate decarboxylase [SAR202 cluster bacterium]|nr:oxaloacetate decarboxylase [SAR202 cluster bacterium]
MHPTDRRRRFRHVLSGDRAIRPASVWDPISARIAESLAFEIGMMAGSVASAAAVGAPDIAVITLTEFAEQAHRVTRASSLSLMVDADHGYGNAMSVMRTVRELEDAGVAAMTIEDTLLPARHGVAKTEIISVSEMEGKLRAALAARQDPATVVIGRTAALGVEGLESTLARVKAYGATGVDGIFLTDVKSEEQLTAIRGVTSLPLLLGSTPEALTYEIMARHGVRVGLRGHTPFQMAVKAVHDALKHQRDCGVPSEMKDRVASSEVMGIATGAAQHAAWQRDFLGTAPDVRA